MKTCLSLWTLIKPPYDLPYEEAIETAASLGFSAVDLPVCDEFALNEWWNNDRILSTRQLLSDRKIELAQVCLFQNLVGGLGSLSPDKVNSSFQNLEKACRLAENLGAKMINIISPSPDSIHVLTTATLPEYFYINTPDMVIPGMQKRDVDGWRFDAKYRMSIDPDFDWEIQWSNFVCNIDKAASIAKKYHLLLTIENRANTFTPHTDSVLRLMKHSSSNNLGACFNVSQAFLHREILEWAAHKYASNLCHIRACDGDGLACYNLPIGSGIIDWAGLINGLNEIGYNGYISFEWLNDADAVENVISSSNFINKYI